MAFIESVACEFFPVVPYLFQGLAVVSVGLSSLIEKGFEGVHFVYELFAHGLAQGIALAAREVGEQTRQKHHLFLIHRHTVSVLEIFLHHRYIVDNRFFAMFSGYEVGNILHRPRTVKGVHGYEILECGWLELTQVFLHTGRLKLECTRGASLAVKLIGLRIVERNLFHVNGESAGFLYVGHGFFYYGECLEPEEVHFYQAGLFDYASFILRYDYFFLGVGGFVHGGAHRNPVRDFVAADNHAAGVHSRVAHVAFKLTGVF